MQDIKLEEFQTLVGKRFSVEGSEVTLTLSEAKAMGQAVREGGSFSLVFEGPETAQADQGVFKLSCAGKNWDLFLVPIGPFGEGMGFEAVFT
ncbi:MAG: hypothetical protein AAF479_16595 [Pseudomonadota bacterium]